MFWECKKCCMVLCSPHPLWFWVAQHDVSQFVCHLYIWRSGQDGPSQPSWLSMPLLTDTCHCSHKDDKAVMDVLAFKSQLHAQPWHIVSMYNFLFHGTFLLVLPVCFALPSSPFFVNTAETYVLRLSPVSPNPTCTVDCQGVSMAEPEFAQLLHKYTHIPMPDNWVTQKLSQVILLQPHRLKGI